ncbi:zinc-dependent alcohol dehydrogenase family protein [Ktedonosporobacter rubrisoli]|uniref:zinc-dependent alcohol dehydrogenase family protein n=1 Tax=Ktedonosporobacter rubrisoli TaxID=2509675 RepID=UPI001A928B50|nr:NAD(P)-dependent alcohol dehydrogenase [Ktedonosporobacter rubrisoli]
MPQPGSQEVLIKVKAVSLNFRDALVVRGILQPNLSLPAVPVSDGVGEVVARGKAVKNIQIGDRVAGIFVQEWLAGNLQPGMLQSTLGTPRTGMLQEYVVLPEAGVVRVPEHLSNVQAASLPIAGVTAWHALMEADQVRPGEIVLIQGTGGVSLFALQFAVLAGAKVIITSRDQGKLAQATYLGAATTINVREIPAWDQYVLDLTDGRGVDHVLDVGGTATIERSLQAIRHNGHIHLVGALGGMQAILDLPLLFNKNIRLQAIQTGNRAMFEAMNRALSKHKLKPIVGRTFPFEQAPQAFQALFEGNTFGKIAIHL